MLAGTTGSVVGRDLAWQFLKENFKVLNDRYEGGFLLSRLVKVNNHITSVEPITILNLQDFFFLCKGFLPLKSILTLCNIHLKVLLSSYNLAFYLCYILSQAGVFV